MADDNESQEIVQEIRVSLGTKSRRMKIDHDSRMIPEDVISILVRATDYYKNQLLIQQTIRAWNDLQMTQDALRRRIVP